MTRVQNFNCIRKIIVIITVLMFSVLTVKQITASAAPYITSNNCPHDGIPQTLGYAGCSVCGGEGYDWEMTDGEAKPPDSPFSGQVNYQQGSGLNSRVEGDYVVYYRCYNCGVCTKYSQEVYRVQKGLPDIEENRVKNYASGVKSRGDVPVRWCTHCGILLYEMGVSNCYTVAKWAQKHLPADPTPVPVYRLTVTAKTGGRVGGDNGEMEAGAQVTVTAVADNGYVFTGWSGDMKSEHAEFSFVMPDKDITLTADFAKASGSTGIPGVTPSTAPAPTEKPVPTGGATPSTEPEPPSATPQPTPQPSSYIEQYGIYEYYYSTDAGFQIAGILKDTANYIATESSDTAGGTIAASDYTNRSMSYKTGVDAAGNEWYFLDSGSNALLVHPKKYNGYQVDSAEVRYITELVFPETILYGGTEYTVKTIGGATAKYKAPKEDGSSNISSNGNGTSMRYMYEEVHGSYVWNKSGGNQTPTVYNYQRNISYAYGVLGNGRVLSQGERQKQYIESGGGSCYSYARNYLVYNTTLEKVVIPDTVTEISPYAFAWCQKLTVIEGGKNVQNIRKSAFRAEAYPRTSRSPGVFLIGSNKSREYFYYNNSYSEGIPTDIMNAWQNAAQLSGSFVFPELPALKTLEAYSFAYHHNIRDAVLFSSVQTVTDTAFFNCKLDSITVKGMSTDIRYSGGSIKEYEAYGTKGKISRPTVLYCERDSRAMEYGLKWDGYYELHSGYPVTYEPNGAAGEAVTLYGKMNMERLMTDEYFRYADVTVNGEIMSIKDDKYAVALEDNGTLWMADCKNNKASQVAPGTVFTKLEPVYYKETPVAIAVYAWDEDGGLWFSGRMDEEVADFSNWKKLTLPETPKKVRFIPGGAYVLGTSGRLWRLYAYSTGTAGMVQLNQNGPLFSSFDAVKDVGEDGERKVRLFGVTAEGKLWYTWCSGYSSAVEWSAMDNEVPLTDIFGVRKGISACYGTGADGTVYKNQAYVSRGRDKVVFPGHNIVEARPLCGRFVLKDSFGASWAFLPENEIFAKIASKGTEVKQIFQICGTNNVSNTDDLNSDYGEEYVDRTVCLLTDGTLRMLSMNGSGTVSAWDMSAVKFKKVMWSWSRYGGYVTAPVILGLAKDGTLWSAGANRYGQTGNPASYGYTFPAAKYQNYMTQAGTGFYQDIYDGSVDARNYSAALGTDGKIYTTGILYPGDGYGNEKVIQTQVFTHAASALEWKRESTLNVIRGYSFEVEIADNFFTHDGYDFVGWNTSSDGSGEEYAPGDKKDLFGSLVLYAQWQSNRKIIRYERNGGSGTMEDTVLASGTADAVLSPNEYTRKGYQFTEWNTKADGTGTSYEDGAKVTGVQGMFILYAQWQPVRYTVQYAKDEIRVLPAVLGNMETWVYDETPGHRLPGEPFSKNYTISYDLNRGTKSTVPVLLTDLTDRNTKAAFTFTGWRVYRSMKSGILSGNSYSFLGKTYAAGTVVNNLTDVEGDSLVLFPSWGGEASNVILPEVSCTGYSFYGWAKSPAETRLENILYVLNEDREYEETGYQPLKNGEVLYAYFEPETYQIRLNGRGATKQEQYAVTMTFDGVCPQVSVPEKTGYTFLGYYSGTFGTGVPYFDEAGKGVRAWQQDSLGLSELYAYWVQNEVVPPEKEEHEPPYVQKEDSITGSLYNKDGKVLLYADDGNPATGALTDRQPYLAYDMENVVEGAIPSTEQLCVRGSLGAWMLSYRLAKCSGVDMVRIVVTVPYRTQYETSDETLVISGQQTAEYSFLVPKAWSYWEAESALFLPSEVRVKNKALEDGEVTIPVEHDASFVLPEFSCTAYGAKEGHILWDTYGSDGVPEFTIALGQEEYIISDEIGKEPDIAEYLMTVCENAAWSDVRQCRARSDSFLFLGKEILSDVYQPDGNGADVLLEALPTDGNIIPRTSYEQTYLPGLPLCETAPNGSYATSAEAVYKEVSGIGGSVPAEKTVPLSANAIRIHTPVVCHGLLAMEGSGQDNVLILKKEANLLRVRADSYGTHLFATGYGEQNFACARSGRSNLAKENGVLLNQVKFSFDVFSETEFVPAGTWVTTGDGWKKFYVPVTQNEGRGMVEYRSIAVNGPRDTAGRLVVSEENSQMHANTNPSAYVAYDKKEIEIRGYAYGLQLVGTPDKAALKVLEAGEFVPVLKTGYPVEFCLRTNGSFVAEAEDTSCIRIIPVYEWISPDKRTRKPVKVYYTEAIGGELRYFVEVGSEEDLQNVHFVRNTEQVSIPMFTFSGIEIDKTSRTFPERDNIFAPVLTEGFETAVQEWHGTFYLPSRLYAASGDTFLKEGYLAVGFQIEAVNRYGKIIPYDMESTPQFRERWEKSGFPYREGDVFCYYLNSSAGEDYEVGEIR